MIPIPSPLVGLLLVVGTPGAVGPLLAATFPYTARVTAEDVYIRSGPGKHYYPTRMVERETEVEVYRHDPGGWCAIRPPRGSFSWVSARYLEVGDDGLGRVGAARVASRVGSRLDSRREVVQVRLEEGEIVKVLESVASRSAGNSADWYKIAPPSGEFRWIHESMIERISGEPARDVPTPATRSDREDPPPQLLPGTVVQTENEAETYRSPMIEELGDMRNAASDVSSRNEAGEVETPFEEEIQELRRSFSTILLRDPEHWRFELLNDRALGLLEAAETALERGKTQQILDAIHRAEHLRARFLETYRTERSVAEGDAIRIPGDPVPSPARATPASYVAEDDGRFDAHGRLGRFETTQANHPPYALVNGKQEITCYLTPAAGVNLEPYVNQQIGVNGVRGFFRERLRHVTVKSVFLLRPEK
jgi:hypothetical protein